MRVSRIDNKNNNFIENLRTLPPLSPNQTIIRPLSNPIKPSGHLQILYGNLAPSGSVAKITGKEGLVFSGPAKVYDCEEDMLKSLEDGGISKGDVVVIRYEGPKGGPGMPEMCKEKTRESVEKINWEFVDSDTDKCYYGCWIR